MKAKHLCICLTSLLLLAVVSTPLSAEWTVSVLTPSGYVRSGADGVSGDQQVGSVHAPTTGNYYPNYHASLWSGTAASWVDLHPTGATSSYAVATSGGQQVGYVMSSTHGQHAGLWTGNAASYVDLHPAGVEYFNSWAYGTSGSQQVGQVIKTIYHSDEFIETYVLAALWSGSAQSFIDLTPGATNACAYGVWNGQQVGWVGNDAVLWSGTAESRVNLNPEGCVAARAYGIADGQQVGYTDLTGNGAVVHASLWTGTAASRIDLHPTGCNRSYAYGVSGGWQVGRAVGSLTGGEDHASLWHGTASSWMDLHALLPAGYSYSWAKGVYVSGGNISVAGFAHSAADNRDHAILWQFNTVPEPSSFLALGSGLLGLCGLVRRRRA